MASMMTHIERLADERKNGHACNDTHWLATTAHLAVSVECAKCGTYLIIAGQVANTLLVNTEHTCTVAKKNEGWFESGLSFGEYRQKQEMENEKNEQARRLLEHTGGVVSDRHTTEPADEVPAPRVLGHEGPSPDYFS